MQKGIGKKIQKTFKQQLRERSKCELMNELSALQWVKVNEETELWLQFLQQRVKLAVQMRSDA